MLVRALKTFSHYDGLQIITLNAAKRDADGKVVRKADEGEIPDAAAGDYIAAGIAEVVKRRGKAAEAETPDAPGDDPAPAPVADEAADADGEDKAP